ncbi:MAG: flagellar assembly protein FliW [Kurthia gibsonii]|uniref:Flagellar assembly factor FliW n=1 Tax=Kurthia gibsonii TaxID=33946 RepID=A0ABU9LNQ1_9BACL|nr:MULTISPECIES: flagellar assembly protein FliW [Kurthia]AMA62014.1 flagellar assembly factor FliW [Kurthia sp. 11kri321]MEB7773285.1 flagellar assembly protein FliW [Kurthia gibsonii]HZG11721.1 flagellar assembly protein FliW [Kurthia gibsonii]
MKIQTKFLGEVQIDPASIIQFPQGIPAFEEEKEFVVIPLGAQSPFVTLQSVQTPSVGFMAAYPYHFKPNYAFDLEQEDLQQLQIEKSEDVLVYAILTLKDTLENSTMNLLAPVAINVKKQIGKQVVLHENAEHPLRYPLKPLEGSVR